MTTKYYSTMHGYVDFDADTWMVIERTDGAWELRRDTVSITYYELFNNMGELVEFLRRQEKGN